MAANQMTSAVVNVRQQRLAIYDKQLPMMREFISTLEAFERQESKDFPPAKDPVTGEWIFEVHQFDDGFAVRCCTGHTLTVHVHKTGEREFQCDLLNNLGTFAGFARRNGRACAAWLTGQASDVPFDASTLLAKFLTAVVDAERKIIAELPRVVP